MVQASASTPPPVNPHGLDYGDAFPQLAVINVPEVHDIWIDGTDITVGMLDNGFRWRTHEAMLNTDVRGEFDVINGDSLTENEEGDLYGQDAHGTVTFSALASFKEGRIIGPAFNAAFYLAKTEVNGSETQIEEDYWVEGIEWLEARGASIVSAPGRRPPTSPGDSAPGSRSGPPAQFSRSWFYWKKTTDRRPRSRPRWPTGSTGQYAERTMPTSSRR